MYMKSFRKYGKPPYNIVLVHGGPGAGGEMAPVARGLEFDFGVLEPIQSAMSIQGQVEELKEVLDENGDMPFILVGFSWGAWLSYVFAAEHPTYVKKLILISCGPFEVKYAKKIGETRLKRLSNEERAEVNSLMDVLNNPGIEEKTLEFKRLGDILSKADAFDPIEPEHEEIELQVDVFQSLWNQATRWRRSGRLLRFGEAITCPVVAIHGDFDPHPAEGVEIPLSLILQDFRFILLAKCGHKPWIEREAKDEFYKILREELTTV